MNLIDYYRAWRYKRFMRELAHIVVNPQETIEQIEFFGAVMRDSMRALQGEPAGEDNDKAAPSQEESHE